MVWRLFSCDRPTGCQKARARMWFGGLLLNLNIRNHVTDVYLFIYHIKGQPTSYTQALTYILKRMVLNKMSLRDNGSRFMGYRNNMGLSTQGETFFFEKGGGDFILKKIGGEEIFFQKGEKKGEIFQKFTVLGGEHFFSTKKGAKIFT